MADPHPQSPYLAEVADDPRLGGKARSLARLEAAGLRVPDGFVVTDALFRAICPALPRLAAPLDESSVAALEAAAARLEDVPFPADFSRALATRLRALGGEVSVRSSFADEDRAGALAPGVYESRVRVPPPEVEAALRAVLRSALSAGAAAYAQSEKRAPEAAPVAVLVHRHVDGEAHGSAAFDPAAPLAGRGPSLVQVRSGTLGVVAARALESALVQLSARFGAVEVEWVARGDDLTFLQLRPYQAPAPVPLWAGLGALPAGENSGEWRWDAAHNPLPLSTAHAGLIDLVDARCRIGLRQRVLGGYLFWRPDPPGPSSATALTPPSAETLTAEVAALAADIDDWRRQLLAGRRSLREVLEGFLPLYERILGKLQPAARAARRALGERLRLLGSGADAIIEPTLAALLAGVPSKALERQRLLAELAAGHPGARTEYLALFGDEPARWDIAASTLREDPGALARLARRTGAASSVDWRAAATVVRNRLPRAELARFDSELAAARAAVAAGEDDDWLYARLQAPVRHAVLKIGESLVARGALADAAEVFHLSLDWLAADRANGATAEELRDLVARGRAAEEAALRDPPPLPEAAPLSTPVAGAVVVVRGSGTGGRAIGRVVHRHGPRGHAPPADAVLVATTLLPTELPLLQVAALVTETGGLLDHVAAQARERGLPAVVGAARARTLLPEGSLVVVDANRGLIIRCD